MIDCHTWPTPNGHKVHIMLEECGLDYTARPVNIEKGEQFDPDFLVIGPNNKIPAIVDHVGPGGRAISAPTRLKEWSATRYSTASTATPTRPSGSMA